MSLDAVCVKCHEPWEVYYLRRDGIWDHPGPGAPRHLIEEHETLVAAEEALLDQYCEPDGSIGPRSEYWDEHKALNSTVTEALLKAVLKGDGCPACWYDPSRVTNDDDREMRALAHNLFNSGWDGDPAELIP